MKTTCSDLNGIIKNSLKMLGSRGNTLVWGPKGANPLPLGETEFSHFYSLKIGLSWTEVKIRRLERINNEEM